MSLERSQEVSSFYTIATIWRDRTKACTMPARLFVISGLPMSQTAADLVYQAGAAWHAARVRGDAQRVTDASASACDLPPSPGPLVEAERRKRSKTMIRWFLRGWIENFERTWNYDASYLHDLLDADPRAMWAFSKVTGLSSYRKDVPLAAYCAAGIIGAMAEDCGPCTQLGIDMAQRNGVDPAILRAVVARDYTAMPSEVALAARFAEASLRHAPEADDLREEVVKRWGKRGLVSLAFALTSSRLYPTLKYALGHGRACTRLTVGGETKAVLRQVNQAA
jgi:hypothetical protein